MSATTQHITREESIPLEIEVRNMLDKKLSFCLFAKDKPTGLVITSKISIDRIMSYEELVNKTNRHKYKLGLIEIEAVGETHYLLAQLTNPIWIMRKGETVDDFKKLIAGTRDMDVLMERQIVPFIKLNQELPPYKIGVYCNIEIGDGQDLYYEIYPNQEVKFSLYPSDKTLK